MAIAYVMQKAPFVFPVIGGRKIEHLHQNLEALEIALTDEHIKYIESILPFELGFPYNVFVSEQTVQFYQAKTYTEFFRATARIIIWSSRLLDTLKEFHALMLSGPLRIRYQCYHGKCPVYPSRFGIGVLNEA